MILRDIPQLKPPPGGFKQVLRASCDFRKFTLTEISNALKRQQVLFLSGDEVRTVNRKKNLVLFDMIPDGAHAQILNPSLEFDIHPRQPAFVDFNPSHGSNRSRKRTTACLLKSHADGLQSFRGNGEGIGHG